MSDMTDLKEVVKAGMEKLEAKFNAQYRQIQDELTDLSQKSGGHSSMPGVNNGGNPIGQLAMKMQQAPELKAWQEGNRLANRLALDLNVKALMEQKATITNTSVSTQADRQMGIVPMARRKTWLWEFLTIGQTSSNGVEYLRESSAIQVAGIQSAEGEAKDEAAYTFDLETATVKTYAHWTQVTRQAYADQPALQAFLRDRMMEGCWRKLEADMLATIAGSNGHTAFTPSSGYTGLDSTRAAMGQLQDADYTPGLIVLNPVDFAAMEAERSTDGVFVYGTPASAAMPQLWGCPVHVSADMNQGDFIVLDVSAMGLWLRETAQVLVSDSHGTTFTANVLTCLAEMRAAHAVLRPEAVMYGALTAA